MCILWDNLRVQKISIGATIIFTGITVCKSKVNFVYYRINPIISNWKKKSYPRKNAVRFAMVGAKKSPHHQPLVQNVNPNLYH